jgi:renalase
MKEKTQLVTIIGAGAAGLSARLTLRSRGVRSLVLEKSRGTGGRMSSRRGEGWVADLGAQFTAATDSNWSRLVRSQAEALLELWHPDRPAQLEESRRFAHREGMSAFARALLTHGGDASDVSFESRVTRIQPHERGWEVQLASGESFHSVALVMTAPVPQALQLFAESGLKLGAAERSSLERLAYDPCLAVLAELDTPIPESVPALLKNPSASLSGVFAQGRKGLRGAGRILVAHASPTLSRALWDRPESEALARILLETQSVLQPFSAALDVRASGLHRWRYCEPVQVHPEAFFRLNGSAPLYLAGDAFGRSSVEGAFVSGAAAARELLRELDASSA